MDWKQLSEDFRQKYEHCYALVTLEGNRKAELFYLEEVEPTSKAPLLHFVNNAVGEIILKYDDSASDIDWKFPSIGLIAYKGTACMVNKKYDRQWKGGVCSATLAIKDIYSNLDLKLTLGYNELDFESLEIAFQPRPLRSISEGIKQLGKNVAVPLSPEFAIGLHVTDSTSLLLFYYQNPIGIVNVDSRYILLKEPQFKQEFQDFTRQIQGVDHYEIRC